MVLKLSRSPDSIASPPHCTATFDCWSNDMTVKCCTCFMLDIMELICSHVLSRESCLLTFAGVMYTDLTVAEAREACSSLDVLVGSFVTSWMSCHCAQVEFWQAGHSWEVITIPSVLHFGDNGSHCGLLSQTDILQQMLYRTLWNFL